MCEHRGGMTKFSKAKFRTHYLAVMNIFIMIKIMLQKCIILMEYKMIENIWNDLVLVERPIRPVNLAPEISCENGEACEASSSTGTFCLREEVTVGELKGWD